VSRSLPALHELDIAALGLEHVTGGVPLRCIVTWAVHFQKLAIASRRRKFSRISAYYLVRRFNLSSHEFAMVLGSAGEYKAAEVADRNAIVALKLSKKELATLAPTTDK